MTTSRETDALDYPALRKLIDDAHKLTIDDRLALLKGIIPSIAAELHPRQFEAFAMELRLKGERFYDATHHPGKGKDSRSVMGERDLEGR